MFFVAMLVHDGTQELLINRFGKTAASGKWLGFLDCLGCFIGAYFVEPINFLKKIFFPTSKIVEKRFFIVDYIGLW